jgi:hypothetical protein
MSRTRKRGKVAASREQKHEVCSRRVADGRGGLTPAYSIRDVLCGLAGCCGLSALGFGCICLGRGGANRVKIHIL